MRTFMFKSDHVIRQAFRKRSFKNLEDATPRRFKQINVLNAWSEQYPEVTRWLGKLQRKPMNDYCLYRFCSWVGKTPRELLALKDDSRTC